MEIRKLDIAEHGKTRPLYEEVFDEDSQAFVDYYYTEKTRDNQIYVIEEDGDIQAMLHLNPYEVMVNGGKKDVDYIVAVATRAAYRRRGYMGELLGKALRDMYAAGRSFTFLMPAEEAIYTPYDFRTVYEQRRKNCPRRTAGELVLEDGRVCQVSPVTEPDMEELADAANQELSMLYQVYAYRSGDYYRRLKKEYAADGAELMVYRCADTIVDCRPFIPEEQPGEIPPKIMVRIIDVRRILMSVRLRTLAAVCFQITDPVIEENNRCVVITGTEFSGVMLMDSKPENSEGTVTISALAEFIFGAKTVEEICMEDGVEMTERMKAELQKIVPLSRIYLNEVV